MLFISKVVLILAKHRPEKEKWKEFMIARHITLQLKPPLAKESPVAFEKEIVPLLKPSGVSSKAANWGHFKTGQRKWRGTVS